MNRFTDLLETHCPEGVEFRPLRDLLEYEQPGKYLVKSTAYDDSFATPVLTAGKTFVLGYTDETEGIFPASPEEPVIIFDDFTTAFKWVDFGFKAKSSAMKILTPRPGVSLRYVWFAMQMIRYEAQEHARQWIGTYSAFRVPVPPLEVQREIVRILDTFTELEAELEARKRQYAHFRDALFASSESGPVRRVPMGDLGEFIRGNGLQKSDLMDRGCPAIHYGQVHTHYGVWTEITKSFVGEVQADKLRKANPGDLVIATTSENDDAVGKAVAWVGQKSAAVSGDAYIFRHSLNPKYVAYFFQTADFHKQKKPKISGTKVRRISGEGLSKILIPVPERATQDRIVDILDRFDALVNSLTVGLPAEIAARRKQYEHYRDRLLSFEEAV